MSTRTLDMRTLKTLIALASAAQIWFAVVGVVRAGSQDDPSTLGLFLSLTIGLAGFTSLAAAFGSGPSAVIGRGRGLNSGVVKLNVALAGLMLIGGMTGVFAKVNAHAPLSDIVIAAIAFSPIIIPFIVNSIALIALSTRSEPTTA